MLYTLQNSIFRLLTSQLFWFHINNTILSYKASKQLVLPQSLEMLLLKVLAVLSLLAVGCYGHSRPSKWTTGHNKAPPGYYDRPAKINYVSEAKYRKVPCYFTTTPPDK